MDYEKAFKEAYERASLRFGTNVANELFLENKESKEERIRRGLIEYFYDWSKTKSYCWGIPVTDIISFLEKQGEQKSQRMVSVEAKETGYDESEDEEIVKLADEYYDKVLLKECDMEEKDAHHCRISYIHGAKAMLERQKWKPSEEQLKFLQHYADQNNYAGTILTSLLNDLKKL